MTPRTQLITQHVDEPGKTGDCFRACVASIMDMECADVPHFVEDAGEEYGAALQAWLQERGLLLGWCHPKDLVDHEGLSADTVWIACGMGPRGLRHCVVWSLDGLVHDPHPSGGGITEADWFWFICRGSEMPVAAESHPL